MSTQQTVNMVILYGRIGNDPELKTNPNSGGKSLVISVETIDGWKDRSTAEWVTKRNWQRVRLFGYDAEQLSKTSRKGDMVHITGHLETQSWIDEQSGCRRYLTEVVADRVVSAPKNSAMETGGQYQACASTSTSAVPLPLGDEYDDKKPAF